MTEEKIREIIERAGHIRVSATKEELETAEFLALQCRAMGLDTHLESFRVPVTRIEEAHLYANGKEIPCRGYELCIQKRSGHR